MLALAAIFLFTLALSAAAVWLYRRISGWQGYSAALVGRPRQATRKKIGLQHGFISMAAKAPGQARSQAKNVKLRRPRGAIKAPWGW